MRTIPHGYTWTEVIVAGLIVLFAIFLVVLAVNPEEEMAKANDVERLSEVEDVMQLMLTMGVDDPEVFAATVARAANGRVMFGTDTSCAGSYGLQCADEVLADTCLSTTIFPNPAETVPIDKLSDIFNEAKTGYYLDFQEGVLLIGGCYPQAQEKIELEVAL